MTLTATTRAGSTLTFIGGAGAVTGSKTLLDAPGGRILHHLAQRLDDDRNAILLAGFQAPGTRGDHPRQGARSVKLLGRHVAMRAAVVSVQLSAHADQDELAD